ncbi:phenylacrylic acid decarboxylase [Trichoderma arundinaceum]|uniref:Phenylacrylic acid decarboxylase n=1 Tax=Trichoderma arundinaceum TaxID=490622 RepID=A0A395NTW0_TRIAR|nr:phenylacrylic acid decarboxylase [Trichoderma arundinaceum]
MPGGDVTENIPAGDFDLLLFRRRRFRTAKACYPCRRRKVKCDLNQPCGTCISREHPDLCDYTTNTFTGAESSTSEQSPSAREQHNPEAAHVNTAASAMTQGLFVDLTLPYDTKVHLGSESLPGVFSMSGRAGKEPTLSPLKLSMNPKMIFELLCLQDSSTTFPFTNLWMPSDGIEKVYSALPDDDVILK